MRHLKLLKFFISGVCCVLYFSHSIAQETEKPEMKTYSFVLLKKGEHRNQDSLEVDRIQKGHMEHIGNMAETGMLNVAGPFLDDGFLRGIFIFNTTDIEKVKEMVEADPAVKSGRLSYEIHPWMTQKGTVFK